LEINKIHFEKKEAAKKSVQTLTSFVIDKSSKKVKNKPKDRQQQQQKQQQHHHHHNHHHSQHHNSNTDSVLECLRNASLLAEEIRASSDQEDYFYCQILEDVSERLTNSLGSYDKSDDSSNLFSPVKIISHRHKSKGLRRKRFSSKKSEESLLIDKLAEKYLFKKKSKNHCNQNHKRLNNCCRNDTKDELYNYKNFDLMENASIATKNYLKKYGLINEKDFEILIKKTR